MQCKHYLKQLKLFVPKPHSDETIAKVQFVVLWSAVTCHRFVNHRLVDDLASSKRFVSYCRTICNEMLVTTGGIDKSMPNKAVTSHRTPKAKNPIFAIVSEGMVLEQRALI